MDPELRMHKSHDTDFANGNETNGNNSPMMPTLQQVRTAGSVTITPEMFERMYLSPENKVSGDMRRILGNPTPIGLGGFLIAYCPLIFSILEWRGYVGLGAATVGTYYFSGGLIAIIACIFEFILGNTFPATFFGVFGGYFLSYGATFTPYFNAYGAYAAEDPITHTGQMAPPFQAGLGFWNLMMAIFTLYCTICALRTNVMFCAAFFFLMITFILVASAEWVAIEPGMVETGKSLQKAGGATGFVVLVIGWYLELALMLTTVDFPFNLPVFDLSGIVPSGTDMRKRRKGKKDLEKGE
ncbi:hypothetical protein PRZ48_007994 [Zasmidium cellare]|uniref:GPR1/FUN34/YaaH-class plasma membrane protein n=1 Tax=Zasmidium cellare TaxID=395010 RepID=A0ABR0EFI3_ZASCE|nr:hypothetical protein PRZ48_007994 [Zasmidium cellare]